MGKPQKNNAKHESGEEQKGAQQVNHPGMKITKFTIFPKSKWEHMQT
jgi:hypothetical protein